MSKKRKKRVSLDKFLQKFPVVELPVVLGNDTHLTFSQKNNPLDPLEVEDFILPMEQSVDEFTEFIPCFAIPNTDGFAAIVYWKASLMNYQYRLVTYNKRGEVISHQVIAGMVSDGDRIVQSMATIDAFWTIHIISGQSEIAIKNYNPAHSTAQEFELFTDGTIGKLEG